MVSSFPRPGSVRAGSPTADPLSAWLVAGGDERLSLDPATGLNPYGRALLSRVDAIELGSCTMSSMSPLSLEAAARAFRGLARAEADGRLRAAVEEACEGNRASLLAALGLDGASGVRAVFTPSGTDAEIVPLALCAGLRAGRIHNIVVAPSEAGSGTVAAAGGRYPNQLTPFGGRRGAAAPIAGPLSARTEVETVPVRGADGTLRRAEDVDAEVASLVERATLRGETAIVHRIAHSKTGVFAPTLACLERLRARHGDRVIVVVDAAQARIGAASVRRHLEGGDLVMLTGSKFYGGPPFSGVVLVPGSMASPGEAAPEGLFDYLSACDLPASFAGLRAACHEHHNLGLCLRWTAALAEIRAYRALPRAVQRSVIAAFGDSVRRWLPRSPHVVLMASPPVDAGPRAGEGEPQETLPTVFSFSLCSGRGGAALTADELRHVARDLSLGTPWGSFHLGQPVRLDPAGAPSPAVLRVAIGAPLVRVAAGRTGWLDEQIRALVRALDARVVRGRA